MSKNLHMPCICPCRPWQCLFFFHRSRCKKQAAPMGRLHQTNFRSNAGSSEPARVITTRFAVQGNWVLNTLLFALSQIASSRTRRMSIGLTGRLVKLSIPYMSAVLVSTTPPFTASR